MTAEPAVRLVASAADADALRDEIEAFAGDLWAVDEDSGRVDWEEWADRFEKYHLDVDLGSDMSSPGFRRMQSIARAVIREARGA